MRLVCSDEAPEFTSSHIDEKATASSDERHSLFYVYSDDLSSAFFAYTGREHGRRLGGIQGKERFVVEAINVNDVVEEITHLLQISISKSVVIKLNLADNLPAIEVYTTQPRQVIMNLVTNASEAIDEALLADDEETVRIVGMSMLETAGLTGFIQKPYQYQVLIEKVRRALQA